MVVVLLTSTIGISINKMECLKSGITKFSLSEFEDCNPSQEPCSYEERCCDFHKITLDLEYESTVKAEWFQLSAVPSDIFNLSLSLESIFQVRSDYNFYTNLPPPSGFDLLKIVQVFRL